MRPQSSIEPADEELIAIFFNRRILTAKKIDQHWMKIEDLISGKVEGKYGSDLSTARDERSDQSI